VAKAIKNKFGIDPQLIKSGGGAFEISVDGITVFSKKQSGRFPGDEEILKAIGDIVRR